MRQTGRRAGAGAGGQRRRRTQPQPQTRTSAALADGAGRRRRRRRHPKTQTERRKTARGAALLQRTAERPPGQRAGGTRRSRGRGRGRRRPRRRRRLHLLRRKRGRETRCSRDAVRVVVGGREACIAAWRATGGRGCESNNALALHGSVHAGTRGRPGRQIGSRAALKTTPRHRGATHASKRSETTQQTGTALSDGPRRASATLGRKKQPLGQSNGRVEAGASCPEGGGTPSPSNRVENSWSAKRERRAPRRCEQMRAHVRGEGGERRGEEARGCAPRAARRAPRRAARGGGKGGEGEGRKGAKGRGRGSSV